MEILQNNIQDASLLTAGNENQSPKDEFRQVLESKNLTFVEDEHYFQVGAKPKDGWIFYLSVIRTQYTELLHEIIPLLSEAHSAFRIARNKRTVKLILDGELGINMIGQLVVIYVTEEDPLTFAKELISLTKGFRGPSVPATKFLGGTVYTAYYKEVNQIGTITMERGSITWPFTELAPENSPVKKLLWNNKYRPLEIIKLDPKGRVIKANYFKGFFNIQLCIIKEGIKNMWSDEFERDIVDRIKWQYELYQDLADKVPTPKIIDHFAEGDNTYLVMDFIKGNSLSSKIMEIIEGKSWSSININHKIKLLDYLLQILAIIEQLHQLGYVHRDITPVNFMINRKEEIFMIDMELAYSLTRAKPDPPFRLGTDGYSSPEQLACETPTINEDIYALGALMVFCFTGLPPIKFNSRDEAGLAEHLAFYTKSSILSSLMAKCLSQNPEHRPSLQQIKLEIERYKKSPRIESLQGEVGLYNKNPHNQVLEAIISNYIKDLTIFQHGSSNHLWNSLDWQTSIPGVPATIRYPQTGLYTGMTGVLYLLARAKKIGYDITSCIPACEKSWEYIQSYRLDVDDKRFYGLYFGLGGISLALKEGVENGLLANPKYKEYLETCFSGPVKTLTISSGVAGQGFALLRCSSKLRPEVSKPLLDQYLKTILDAQLSDGSWETQNPGTPKKEKNVGWGHGIAGITYFLLMYAEAQNDYSVNAPIQKALKWISVKIRNTKLDLYSFDHGIPGIALTFIKAYEILHIPQYKEIAENLVAKLPDEPVWIDFTQADGLAGLGEMYLEASRVLKTEKWEKRIDWIVSSFIHTQIINKEELKFWAALNYPDFEIDLMSGSSGIIHFLMRYQNRNELGHILLSN